MSAIAGIDFSTHAVDVVLLDENDVEPPVWHRYELTGANAFDRARQARFLPTVWDDVLAVGIEDPRGYNAGALYRVQGAVLARIPAATLVHPLVPSQWRKLVGLPGNASKADVAAHAVSLHKEAEYAHYMQWRDWQSCELHDEFYTPPDWPQDALDAYCIALATRSLLTRAEDTAA